MRRLLAIALLLCAGISGRSAAHDLQYAVAEGGAVRIEFSFGDGKPFSFESYEVYRAGEEVPFQVGRTDALGRLVFLPDRAGTWRIKAFSEDGHGADFSISTGAHGGLEDAERPRFERHLRLVTGISIIFGIFGLISLFARRTKRDE